MSTHGPIATHRTATGIPTGRLAVWWLMASEIFYLRRPDHVLPAFQIQQCPWI